MEKPHYHEHRKRLREKFRRAGLDGLGDYEVLELLLTYAIPRRDVKPLAKGLIRKFGSFSGVMDATYEELVASDGVKDGTATFILALKGATRLYLKERLKKSKTAQTISSTAALLDYCHASMAALKDEQFRVIFLNSQNEVVDDEVVQDGTVDQSVVYPRKVMERALHHKASALILVHNHPGGSCRPSEQDKVLTAQLVKLAGGLGIRVHDHLIVCRGGYFSFLERGLM